MKTLMTVLAGAMLLAGASAHAIVPFKPVRTQVRNQAKSEGILKGLVRPSIRLAYSPDHKTVAATLWSISNKWPTMEPTRMLQARATFTLQSLADGTLAHPVSKDGSVWHFQAHLFSAGK